MLDDIVIYKGYVIDVFTVSGEVFYGEIYHDGDLEDSLEAPSKVVCVSKCVSYIDSLILWEK